MIDILNVLMAIKSNGKNKAKKVTSNFKLREITSKKIALSIFIAVGLIFVLCISWLTGLAPWTIKLIECGEQPVIINGSFWDAGSRVYPGDKNYTPGTLSSYECMTPEEKAGKR